MPPYNARDDAIQTKSRPHRSNRRRRTPRKSLHRQRHRLSRPRKLKLQISPCVSFLAPSALCSLFFSPQSRLRYLQADFLNLQRNAAREKEQQRDYAITRFASDLLETVDVLGLALKSIPPEAFSETAPPVPSSSPKTHQQYLQELHTGVEITNRQLLQTLFKYHVKPFDPTGEIFDPNRHEAMYQVPMQGKEPGTVFHCQKIGYMIKDRVLRAAQVGVVQDTS